MLDASIRDPSQVEILIEQGTAHAGILRVMGRIRAGAVVVGGKFSPNDSLFLGKTAEAIVRYADCPVWVARHQRTGLVLAATDFSDPALPVVDVAAAEAQRRKLDLAIIHVLDPVPVGLRAYGEFAGLPLMAFRNQMKEALHQKLDDCVVRFNARGGGLLRDGPTAAAILKAASELPAQLLVIGSQGRTGLSRVALGSVAEAVVRAAPCSTLVIRRKP
jgi:nucleotide-binding universal stress UspA family protein